MVENQPGYDMEAKRKENKPTGNGGALLLPVASGEDPELGRGPQEGWGCGCWRLAIGWSGGCLAGMMRGGANGEGV